MKPEREELIDFVLAELPGERHRAVAERVARDPEAAAERDDLQAACAALRAAAADGWAAPAPRARWRLVRPALAAAAVLLVALGLHFLNGASMGAVYEPDGRYGYLLAEETDARGRVRDPSQTAEYLVKAGEITISALGSNREYPLKAGETFPPESEIKTSAETGARIDLPQGGILFLGPISTLRVRRHQDGGPALRLIDGVAATVAEGAPLHLAVHETDLLLVQERGAALLRESPAEAVALRGDLFLLLPEGKRFRVPRGERLPAACATAPRTAPTSLEELDLPWYRDLVYRSHRVEEVVWEADGRSRPITATARTLVYLRVEPTENGAFEVSFGGEPREFPVRAGHPLELRLRLRDLGPGPHLEVSGAVREARVFEAVPRVPGQ